MGVLCGGCEPTGSAGLAGEWESGELVSERRATVYLRSGCGAGCRQYMPDTGTGE